MDEDNKALMKKIDAFLENRGVEAQSRPGILDRMKMFYYASEVQGVDIARYIDTLGEEDMPEEDEFAEFDEAEDDYEDEEADDDYQEEDDYEDPRVDNRRREQRRAPIDDSMGDDDDIDIEPLEEEKVEVRGRGRPPGERQRMPPPNPPKRAPAPPEPIRGPPKPALKKPEFTPPSQDQIDEGAF